ALLTERAAGTCVWNACRKAGDRSRAREQAGRAAARVRAFLRAVVLSAYALGSGRQPYGRRSIYPRRTTGRPSLMESHRRRRWLPLGVIGPARGAAQGRRALREISRTPRRGGGIRPGAGARG